MLQAPVQKWICKCLKTADIIFLESHQGTQGLCSSVMVLECNGLILLVPTCLNLICDILNFHLP